MASNSTTISPEILKRTKGSLGALISKPALTDKLLSKPPFRFLHDILTEILKNTGFLRGLFTAEEMNSEKVKDKEKKLLFLQKVIDVVMFATGQKLKVKPTRIVAGAEPERTNEMLQLIAYCVQKKIDSSEAVKKVLNGEKPFSGQEKPEENPKRETVKPEQKEKDPKVNGDPVEPAVPQNDELASKGSRTRLPERREDKSKRSRSQDPSEDAERKKRGERARKERREHSEEDRGKRRDSSEDRIKRREISEEYLKRGSSRDSRRPPVPDQSPKRGSSPTPQSPPEQVETLPEPQAPSPPAHRQRPASAKRSRRQDPEIASDPPPVLESGSLPPNNSHISMPEADIVEPALQAPAPTAAEHSSSENEAEMEYPSLISRPPIRPSTARKAPPKRRETSQEGIDRIQSGKKDGPKVYLDTGPDQDDMEEQFIVQEGVDALRNDGAEMLEEGQHGGLTKKLLETKKRLEGNDGESDQVKVNELQKHTQKEITRQEIVHMQQSIQSICQNAAPLAKIVDYVHEDLDAMRNELSKWTKENEKYSKSLEKEEGLNEEIFKPYHEELEQIDEQIEDTKQQIVASRVNYLQNADKIEKLLESISFASQQ